MSQLPRGNAQTRNVRLEDFLEAVDCVNAYVAVFKSIERDLNKAKMSDRKVISYETQSLIIEAGEMTVRLEEKHRTYTKGPRRNDA